MSSDATGPGDFLRYYAGLVDRRAGTDPVSAVGGLWDELGELQFEFLRGRGLRPTDELLDYGCGCLRGGLHFIRYLDDGNYAGVDASAAILEAGRQFLAEAGLVAKHPTLRLVDDLSFTWFGDRTFNVVFAQSVFTHMPFESVQLVFANVGRVLAPDAEFYATFFPEGSELRSSSAPDAEPWEVGFEFAPDALVAEGASHALAVDVLPVADYPHPRGQHMLRIRRRSATG